MEQINRTLVTSQIADYIKTQITSEAWQLGQKIPSENILSKTLGVSRASLRNAIGQFIALGILQSQQGKGCYLINNNLVGKIGNLNALDSKDYQDIRQVLEFRLLLEPQGCALCCALESLKHQQLCKELEILLQTMQYSLEDSKAFIQADLQFHRLIGFSCGNKLLGASLDNTYNLTYHSLEQLNTLFGFESGLKHHHKILEALRSRDDKKAFKCMYKHLDEALSSIKHKQ